MVSDVILCRLVQSTCPPLLFGVHLHGYGFSFRNVPGSDQYGIHDNYQSDGDSDSDSESGVEAAGLDLYNYGIAIQPSMYDSISITECVKESLLS